VALGALAAAAALVGAACQTESVTVSPPPSIRPAETTLAECVVKPGPAVSPRPAGMAFRTIKPGALTVGAALGNPPFGSVEDGKPVGFDIGLIAEVGRRLELRTEVRAAPAGTLPRGLAADELDVAASALVISEQARRTVDFTDAYLEADQSLVVRIVDSDLIDGLGALSKRLVGVRAASPGEECARRALKAQKKVRGIRSFPTLPAAFDALLDRRIDAVIAELPAARAEAERRPGLAIVEIIRTDAHYGFAVARDNPGLREAINRQLGEMRADGTYDRIHERWLGTGPPPE
jgi:polar amino acid transport system substrate-binding protein